MFIPREEQKEVLNYTTGTMGISAVPGAGKTATLSALAADLVEEIIQKHKDDTYSDPEQEVLIVSFSNSAETNFSVRIANMLEERGLTPGIGYKVRTLHGMALDIIQGHAQQIGIPDEFSIVDENMGRMFLDKAVSLWLEKDKRKTFNKVVDPRLPQNVKDEKYNKDWKADLIYVMGNVISQIKDYHISPEELRSKLDVIDNDFIHTMLEAVSDIYTYYQENLRNYPAMDFADLMYNAYRILKQDNEYLEYIQNHYTYVLEDEAQDSSRIQEEVLRLITEKSGNWVRVGDPNQAINETFTTASPEYLLDFLKKADHTVDLKRAGRSQPSILRAANRLINIISDHHPNKDIRDALTQPYIYKTKPGDAQGNPEDDPSRVVFDPMPYSPLAEIDNVCRKAAEHVKKYPKETTVILVPTNEQGKIVVDALAKYPVEVVEYLKSTSKARDAAGDIAAVLLWLSKPLTLSVLNNLFKKLFDEKEGEFFITEEDKLIVSSILLSIDEPESFFYPDDPETLEAFVKGWGCSELVTQTIFRFRYFLTKWLAARFLPIDQLVLLISQDLFKDPADLCCAGKIGSLLLQASRTNPDFTLADLAGQAEAIANNPKVSAGFNRFDQDFNPNLHKGKIVVTTYHKSKGLEWDQVFAISADNYSFPSGESLNYSQYAWKSYFQNKVNLQAEILQALKVIAFPERDIKYHLGDGTVSDYKNYIKERCRLLYVAITRAKKGLYMSYNTGKYSKNLPTFGLKCLLLSQKNNNPTKEEK